MPITFTDRSYGSAISYDYEDELSRWDTNVNTMCVGELILNDIILVSARNVADIEDKSRFTTVFSDRAGVGISLTDKGLNGVEIDADYIEFDQEGIFFDGQQLGNQFSDNSLSTTTFTDWSKL